MNVVIQTEINLRNCFSNSRLLFMVEQNYVQKSLQEGVNMCILLIIINIIPLMSSAVANLSFLTVLHGHTTPFFSEFGLLHQLTCYRWSLKASLTGLIQLLLMCSEGT